ncbi:MAG: 5'-nucleotidase domain-containing protein, partial [Anaerolineae bacterium]
MTTPVSAAADPTAPPPTRGVYCNRTLNLRAIQAIGYDMDYTLVHYNEGAWENRAYEYSRTRLVEGGWPVSDLTFDPGQVIRGLIIDTELGNIVKANRFGYVKQARHGTRPLGFEDQRRVYGRTIVDLSEPRWVFLNTLFSLSEGALYGQLVARLDRQGLPGVLGYADLYRRSREAVGASH